MAETTRSVRPIPLSDKRQLPDETEIQVGSQAILLDNEGALWITTVGDGLRRSPAPALLRGRIKELSTAIESFTAKDGLSDDLVRAIFKIAKEISGSAPTTAWIDSEKPTSYGSFSPSRLCMLSWLPEMPETPGFEIGKSWPWFTGDILIVVSRFQTKPAKPYLRTATPRAQFGGFARRTSIVLTREGTPRLRTQPPSQAISGRTNRGSRRRFGRVLAGRRKRGSVLSERGVWHRLETGSELAKLSPTTAFTDWMGRAWFGYEGGTIVLLKDENIQRVFSAEDSPVGSVQAINGRGHHTWVAGELGLAFFDGNRFRRIVPADVETFGPVIGVEEVSNGSLWLAESRSAIEIPVTEVQKTGFPTADAVHCQNHFGLYLNHSANIVFDEVQHLVAPIVHDHSCHRQCESSRFFIGCLRR